MFLEIEGNTLLNLALIDRVEMRHHEKRALVWQNNAVVAESEIAYKWLMAHQKETLCAW